MKNTIIKHVNLIAIGYTSVSGEAAVAVNAFSASLPHDVDYSLDPCLGGVVPFYRVRPSSALWDSYQDCMPAMEPYV